jgi:two-component system phosphate regulon response regulator PhoB
MSIDQTTILVVEDEPSIVELVSFTLKAAGWNVCPVGSANEAWNFLQTKTPQLIGCYPIKVDYDYFLR